MTRLALAVGPLGTCPAVQSRVPSDIPHHPSEHPENDVAAEGQHRATWCSTEWPSEAGDGLSTDGGREPDTQGEVRRTAATQDCGRAHTPVDRNPGARGAVEDFPVAGSNWSNDSLAGEPNGPRGPRTQKQGGDRGPRQGDAKRGHVTSNAMEELHGHGGKCGKWATARVSARTWKCTPLTPPSRLETSSRW